MLFPITSVIKILCLFLNGLPKEIIPSNEAKTAIFFGLLASNNSETLGRPPVISFDFWVAFGVFAIISAISNFLPSWIFKDAFGSSTYLIISFEAVANKTVGLYPAGIYSFTTSFEVPVNSSNCSETVTPGIISSNVTIPACSAIVGFAYGSHSAITICSLVVGAEICAPFSTSLLSFRTIEEPLEI